MRRLQAYVNYSSAPNSSPLQLPLSIEPSNYMVDTELYFIERLSKLPLDPFKCAFFLLGSYSNSRHMKGLKEIQTPAPNEP